MPHLTDERIRQLAQSDDPGIRWEVAVTERTPSGVLDKLADDTDVRVRRRVVLHSNTPLDALKRLSQDVVADVAAKANERIAWRARCSPD